VPSVLLTLRSWPFAVASAAAWVTVGLVASVPIGFCCATEFAMTWPAPFVTRTKSPPITDSPLYVRSYET